MADKNIHPAAPANPVQDDEEQDEDGGSALRSPETGAVEVPIKPEFDFNAVRESTGMPGFNPRAVEEKTASQRWQRLKNRAKTLMAVVGMLGPTADKVGDLARMIVDQPGEPQIEDLARREEEIDEAAESLKANLMVMKGRASAINNLADEYSQDEKFFTGVQSKRDSDIEKALDLLSKMGDGV